MYSVQSFAESCPSHPIMQLPLGSFSQANIQCYRAVGGITPCWVSGTACDIQYPEMGLNLVVSTRLLLGSQSSLLISFCFKHALLEGSMAANEMFANHNQNHQSTQDLFATISTSRFFSRKLPKCPDISYISGK